MLTMNLNYSYFLIIKNKKKNSIPIISMCIKYYDRIIMILNVPKQIDTPT